MVNNLLTFHDLRPGIQEFSLNTGKLYPSQKERDEFEERLSSFLKSDDIHSKIFRREGEFLTYRSECIIPEKRDSRTPLLLVFGNPASHSVDSEMFFSFEGNKREHRLWNVLREAGFLSFTPDKSELKSISTMDLEERNQLRKKQLYNLGYDSPFRLGLAVFYSMPTPASSSQKGSKWGGVTGLYRLFRKKALLRIGECERDRVEGLIREFVSPKGAVIAFQKDAYLGIKSLASPDYKLTEAKEGKLIGNCQCLPSVRLYCSPPTRQMQGKVSLALLRTFKQSILEVS